MQPILRQHFRDRPRAFLEGSHRAAELLEDGEVEVRHRLPFLRETHVLAVPEAQLAWRKLSAPPGQQR